MKGQGQGWTGESRRHGLARMGYKTVLPDGRRLHMGNFVAGGDIRLDWMENFKFNKEFEEGNILIWDNQGRTADNYTILIDKRYVFGMDDRPSHPQGFNQYSGDIIDWSLLSRTPYKDVSGWIEIMDKEDRRLSTTQIRDNVKKAILNRMEDE